MMPGGSSWPWRALPRPSSTSHRRRTSSSSPAKANPTATEASGGREFERRFQLADHVRVTSANLQNGLLSIDLQRELPEEKKPRSIRIERQASPRTITQQ
jgi:hypothetical protein